MAARLAPNPSKSSSSSTLNPCWPHGCSGCPMQMSKCNPRCTAVHAIYVNFRLHDGHLTECHTPKEPN